MPDLRSYDTVFLGLPIWGTTAPPVIRSFLSRHDLSSKTLVPFITHGGYGLGNSLAVVARHAPRAHIVRGFSKRPQGGHAVAGEDREVPVVAVELSDRLPMSIHIKEWKT